MSRPLRMRMDTGNNQQVGSNCSTFPPATEKWFMPQKEHIEAPNWSVDGKFLIYNSGGLLYKFPLATKKPENQYRRCHKMQQRPRPFIRRKMLAISSSAKLPNGRSGSMVYTVPVTGGIPKAITQDVPSYWSWLVARWQNIGSLRRAERRFRCRNSSNGGKEFQLTTSKGLDDGPEYARDGKRSILTRSAAVR